MSSKRLIGAMCCVAVAAFLGACAKNGECCGECKDKPAVKMETSAAPAASTEKKSGCCAEKASCDSKKSGCSGKSSCSSKSGSNM